MNFVSCRSRLVQSSARSVLGFLLGSMVNSTFSGVSPRKTPTNTSLENVHMNRYTATDKTLRACPLVKKKLWGGEFWTDGFCEHRGHKHGDESQIGNLCAPARARI